MAFGTWVLSPACTSEDSLLEGTGSSGTGGVQTGGATGAGAAQAGAMHATGGVTNQGGTSALGGTSAQGGALDGGRPPGEAGSGGLAEEMGGSRSEGGEGTATGGQTGGNAGSGTAGASTGTVCSEITDFDSCEATLGCHSVFEDSAVCGCSTVGCCARFVACASGEKADCEGRTVECDAPTPFCDSPAYVVSHSSWCYEGCVDPKDCGACGAPEDPSGCLCYVDRDCPAGNRCYGADCGSETPGTCRMPPVDGCFGDADCAVGATCIGGRPAPCGTAIVDVVGTCGTEECATEDCPGSFATNCSCWDGNQCVAATGPTGSGQCRNADGTCSPCKCAAPDTPIATPTGDRAIAELEPGDLVYSVDGAGIRAVEVLRVNRTPVVNHRVLRIAFDNGRLIEMTAGHPLADGRPLSTLRPGSELLGANVVNVTDIAFTHEATFDILPDSTSGAYFAAGVLIGSTLSGPARGELPATLNRAPR